VTGIEEYLPKTQVVMKGSEVTFSILNEILIGEDKFVFLY